MCILCVCLRFEGLDNKKKKIGVKGVAKAFPALSPCDHFGFDASFISIVLARCCFEPSYINRSSLKFSNFLDSAAFGFCIASGAKLSFASVFMFVLSGKWCEDRLRLCVEKLRKKSQFNLKKRFFFQNLLK